MLIRKALFHAKSIFVILWYKLLYRGRFSYGARLAVRNRFSVMISKNGAVRLGSHCFFNNDCSINCLDEVRIGDNCIFGEGVRIYDHNHRFRDEDRPIADQGFVCDKVSIGDNCWIGSGAIILRGARIGRHCVIGAGAVISKNIEDHTIVKSGHHQIEIAMEYPIGTL